MFNFTHIRSSLDRAVSLLKWVSQASSIDTLDSPLAVDFVDQVILTEWEETSYTAEIESIRSKHLSDKTIVKDFDLGAKSSIQCSERSVSEVVKSAVSRKAKCHLIYHIVQHLHPSSILELGTSLGISTYYLAAANPASNIQSIEGSPQLSEIAKSNSPSWADKIEWKVAPFKEQLEECIKRQQTFDLIYVDGAHSRHLQTTLWPLYLRLCHQETIFIIDDIYWSKDMTMWWNELLSYDRWNVVFDLYEIGILMHSDKVKEKIHKKLSPVKWRWQLGLTR